MGFLNFLEQVVERRDLNAAQAHEAMLAILGAEASTAQVTAFLVALRMKGETSSELLGFARAMREKAQRVETGSGSPLLDTCGTGGDRSGTFNISTAVAFVAAGAGVRVAKHGNRSISSQCGSADVMEGLGVKVALTAEQMGQCIRSLGIGFLFAPAVHTAMKHAQPARLELKMRTVFNILGPLTNPAGASAQLVGAPSAEVAKLMADALAGMGLAHGFVVHGSDGLDEITTTGPTVAFEIQSGQLRRHDLTPEDFGVGRANPEDLRGGDRATNCEIVESVLRGATGPRRDIVLVNAAVALVAADMVRGFGEGMKLAAAAIDSGAALAKVRSLAHLTQQLA
jgi:anthranilate phosphoribosyltransferase